MHKKNTSNSEQANVFNDVVVNILSNFVLNKIIEIGDMDPPWMNDFITNKIKQKKKKHLSYTKIIEWVLISLTFGTYHKVYLN